MDDSIQFIAAESLFYLDTHKHGMFLLFIVEGRNRLKHADALTMKCAGPSRQLDPWVIKSVLIGAKSLRYLVLAGAERGFLA